MSDTIKLSSQLPGDEEINGLDHLADDLINDPDQVLCCLAWMKIKDVRRIIETDAEVLTVEIRRIEPIATVDATPPAVIKLAAELYEARTGRDPLPFPDIVASLDKVTTGGADLLDED